MVKFSVSDASLFKLCPRRFLYEKVEGYNLVEEANHLKLGKAYDKLLEVWDENNVAGKPFEETFAQIPELFEDAHEAAEAEVLLKVYNEKFKNEPLLPIEKGNQYGFGVELGTEAASFRLTGYLDKVTTRASLDGSVSYVVVERKTTAEPIEANSAYWDKLDLDPQIRAYVFALRKQGYKAGWVCYEVVRKLGSTVWNKLKNKREMSPDEYRSLLASMPLDKTLVERRWFYVTTEMAEEFEQEHQATWSVVNLLLGETTKYYKEGYSATDIKGIWPKSEQSCKSYGGCPFIGVCKSQINLNHSQFTKKEGRFSCSK